VTTVTIAGASCTVVMPLAALWTMFARSRVSSGVITCVSLCCSITTAGTSISVGEPPACACATVAPAAIQAAAAARTRFMACLLAAP
jgi:hypothetical protein